jgi:predicted DNA-binding transcriptional regulator AlpA
MDTDRSLISRAELLRDLQISDSTERRHRSGTADWPRHVLIGKKIYYRTSQISAWLCRQEDES